MRNFISSAVMLTAMCVAANAQTAWTPQVLRPLATDDSTRARDINDDNQVAGVSREFDANTPEEDTQTAVIWGPFGFPRALRTPPGFLSCDAVGINNNRQVAGNCFGFFGDAPRRAVRWNRQGQPTVLRGFNGNQDTFAADINERGAVLGVAGAGPVIWQNRTPQRLPGGNLHNPIRFNDRGAVIASVLNAEDERVHVVWPGPFQQPRLLKRLANGDNGVASGINDNNWIAGFADRGFERERAIVWRGFGSVPRLLRTLPGSTTSYAADVNDRNEIAGANHFLDQNSFRVARPVIWNRNGVPRALPVPRIFGIVGAGPTKIAKNGIVGLLQPVEDSEPTDMAVLWKRTPPAP